MATLKRSHAPVPLGAHVEQTVWKRSQSGKPRRTRSDRPPLAHDHGWDWNGTRVALFSETETPLYEGERGDADVQAPLRDDVQQHPTLSLLDIAQYQTSKRRGKARSNLDEFEVVRVPRIVPIAEEFEPDLGCGWMLGEWEKLDALGFNKRTYSEVVQGFLDGKDPPSTPGCSRSATHTEVDLWEYL